MKLESSVFEGVRVLAVAEPVEVDVGNADAFKASALAALGDERNVVLDVSLVEFFDSAGMGALLSLQKRVAERGGRIALAGVNRAVLEVFRMVGFDVVFPIYADVATAAASFR
jgi:anti-sigma B factor antagonist